ncbi:glycosyltransferase domain-containing protein [Lentzea sp. NEAU-D7]|uniref:glycosyltransferase domain-containing protein n=1 Tax=Lentzea sp. NEAU-D7 TaxID=2994667 RepID=UPI00224AA56F|nr:glycosyltransferase domain-containing protein [Lentzea sp. NEAU-D7]MCX2950183.1 hypothetical protein [Lentzea sp. NEAU-D7]
MQSNDLRRRQQYGLTTDAVVLHCPGPLRRRDNPVHVEWEQAQLSFFADASLGKSFQDDPRLTVITYNASGRESLLERCGAHLGITVVVLGRTVRDWSWEHKITLVRDYLESAEPAENVMCLDAFDTLILDGPQMILERFHATSAEILFGCTATDWPPSREHERFEADVYRDASWAHRHLNASYIGKTAEVRRCLEQIVHGIEAGEPWCRTDTGFDDQLAWREMHRQRHPCLKIDVNCSIFVRFDEDR